MRASAGYPKMLTSTAFTLALRHGQGHSPPRHLRTRHSAFDSQLHHGKRICYCVAEAVSALYDFRNRWYSPDSGDFLSRDPVWLRSNDYQAFYASPTHNVDQTGEYVVDAGLGDSAATRDVPPLPGGDRGRCPCPCRDVLRKIKRDCRQSPLPGHPNPALREKMCKAVLSQFIVCKAPCPLLVDCAHSDWSDQRRAMFISICLTPYPTCGMWGDCKKNGCEAVVWHELAHNACMAMELMERNKSKAQAASACGDASLPHTSDWAACGGGIADYVSHSMGRVRRGRVVLKWCKSKRKK